MYHGIRDITKIGNFALNEENLLKLHGNVL
jgi:hypothetical protein